MEPLITNTIIAFSVAAPIVGFTTPPQDRMARITRLAYTAIAAVVMATCFSWRIALPVNIALLVSVFMSWSPPPRMPSMATPFLGTRQAPDDTGGGGGRASFSQQMTRPFLDPTPETPRAPYGCGSFTPLESVPPHLRTE